MSTNPSSSTLSDTLKAAQASIAATTGATIQKSATPQPSIVPQTSIVQPKPTSPSHVIFKSAKSNQGVQFKSEILRFSDGYYQTDSKDKIAYLREFASHFGITEVKPVPEK